DRMHCDHAFYVGGTHENAHLLGELERLPGCCGIKVFMGASTGTLLVQDDEGIEQVLRHVNRRAAFHSEDEYRLAERRPLARTGDWTSHPEGPEAPTASQSTQRVGGRAARHAPRRAARYNRAGGRVPGAAQGRRERGVHARAPDAAGPAGLPEAEG